MTGHVLLIIFDYYNFCSEFVFFSVNFDNTVIRMIKEYTIPTDHNDYVYNFTKSKRRIIRMATKLLQKVGAFSFRVTLDLVMEKMVNPPITQSAGFRSSLQPVSRVVDVVNVVESKFAKIENTIDGYNKNGMSGCVVKQVSKVRVLVVKQML